MASVKCPSVSSFSHRTHAQEHEEDLTVPVLNEATGTQARTDSMLPECQQASLLPRSGARRHFSSLAAP
ncbi:hypothetical protein JOF47_001405 [Paeniglutamicibacter kerguelensis]|uniref:Uncharacterized protein n=1 Tax=Paeniglutamicibacter kerguelensis TaxID=254788 RepID=A0ABS4XBP8_9MICC|nr:hypothetical protein [Paeniglutamicibacter kerguelensis]